MIGNTFQQLFLLGANELATMDIDYGPQQQAAGFTMEEWDLLTTDTCWTKAEQMKLPSMLSNMVSITLRTAGLPAVPLPGAFIAACICKIIAPCNRLVAASSAPESFDVMSAAGIARESVQVITTREQMLALVVYFTSADFDSLAGFPLQVEIENAVLAAQVS